MKIVVCGNYGAKNEGDEMILTGLLKSLKSANPRAKITVMSANPAQTKKRHKIPAIEPFPTGPRSILKALKKGTKTTKAAKECDAFVLGGGGLFAGPSFRANFIWATQAQMAYFFKKKVLMYGQSVGKPTNKVVKAIIKTIFNKAQLIAVRDLQSKKNLQEIGVNKEIHVIPDLAFRYLEKPRKPKKSKKIKVVVALREMKGLKSKFFTEVGDFLKWLKKEKNAEISYINFQEGKYADSAIHKKLPIKLKKGKIQDLKSADYVIGMRLHSIISAIKNEKPFIAINYFSKVINLLKTAGLSKHTVSLDKVTAKTLQIHFEQIEKDAQSKKMNEYNKKALSQLIKFEKTILKSALR